MTYHEREALDNWITGNGGQDQYDDPPVGDCQICGEPLDGDETDIHDACANYENWRGDIGGES